MREFRQNWRILLAAFTCLLFAFSAPAFLMPFLYAEVIQEFGWSREQAIYLLSRNRWEYPYQVGSASIAVLANRKKTRGCVMSEFGLIINIEAVAAAESSGIIDSTVSAAR